MPHQAALRLFCSDGAALFYIARHPGCTIRDLANALVVTQRTIWSLIGNLKRGNVINIRKDGRLHHYWIKEEAPFPDPVLSHLSIGQVMQALSA